MLNGQIEMSFGLIHRRAQTTFSGKARARWWFARMRRVVDLAIDWQPTPPPRPVQTWFPVSDSRGKDFRSPLHSRSDERQICE